MLAIATLPCAEPRHVLQALHGRRHLVDEAPRLRQEIAPDRRQLDRARSAIEQPHREIGLELLDAPRERRLGEMELVRGAAEAAELRDQHERLDAVEVDLHRSLQLMPSRH